MPEAVASDSRQAPLEGVGAVIAVSGCKGGVGKSTVAVNLAMALSRLGHKVGLADVDIYGPSAPIMLGIEDCPRPQGDERIRPIRAHGIDVMSMGFFLDEDAPVIWRGPMAMIATKQFLRGVVWEGLDYLIVDLPPGTGDIALTLAQEIPLDGVVIVTTPQDVALADVRRGIAMFHRLNTPVLGVLENMSGFVCPDCEHRDDLFGSRRGEQLSNELGIALLGEIPIEPALCESGDAGVPLLERDGDHPVSKAFTDFADLVVEALAGARAGAELSEPVEITGDNQGELIRIRWGDGVTTEYSARGLRGWCPCAECQGHSGERRFVGGENVRLERVEGVGRYALRFIWTDGHDTGMYPYDYLRELASYAECKP